MAEFTTTEPIDFLNSDIGDLDDGEPTINTPTQFERQEAGVGAREDFFGTGFLYDGLGNLTGGTITHIASTDAVGAWDLSSFAMPVTTLNGFITGGDAKGFLSTVFSGNDSITGSSGADQLLGYAGNDTLTSNDGNDTLDGGTGIDRLTGGKGDDLYFVDDTKDVVTER